MSDAEKVMGKKLPASVRAAGQALAEGKVPTLKALERVKNFFFAEGKVLKGGPKFGVMMTIFMIPWLLKSALSFFGVDPQKGRLKDLMLQLQQAQMPDKGDLVRQAQIGILVGQMGGASPESYLPMTPTPASETAGPALVPGEQWGGAAAGGSQADLARMLQAGGR